MIRIRFQHIQKSTSTLWRLIWTNAVVISNEEQSNGSRLINFQVTDDVAKEHKFPGQVVRINRGGDSCPALFHLINKPGSCIFSVLVSDIQSNARILNSFEGKSLEVSSPEGEGITIRQLLSSDANSEQPIKQVMIATTTKKIVQLVSGIDDSLSQRSARLKLFILTSDFNQIPLRNKVKEWIEQGVEIIAISHIRCHDYCDELPSSFLVHELVKHGGIPNPANTLIISCSGSDEDIILKDYASAQGVPNERIVVMK